MSRFGSDSLQQIDKVVQDSTPLNTRRSKTSVWSQFRIFCKERNFKLEKCTSIEDLALFLTDWAYNMKKQNGQDYKESVIKVMWNCTAKQLQEMYFKDFNIKFNPFEDIEFLSARAARDAKRRKLQENSEKRKLSSSALTQEELNKMVDLWDEDTPTGLQRKLFLIVGYELAWRGGEASSCKTYYFTEEKDNLGKSTGRIEYNPIFTKTSQGGAKKLADSKWLTINSENPNYCPVRLLKKLLSKRTDFITTERLFLTANPNWKSNVSKGWYKNVPVGRNQISSWLAECAKKIGIDSKKVKITNHSIRATAVSNLAKRGIGEQQLIKVTGHSNPQSIRPYLQMDKEHHQSIINVMRIPETKTPVEKNTASTSQEPNSSRSINYTNCNFYYGL